MQLCNDYRELNKVTIKYRYLKPWINDLFDQLQRAKVFPKIDLKLEHHQLKVKIEDVSKITFRTKVMLFKLTNAHVPLWTW